MTVAVVTAVAEMVTVAVKVTVVEVTVLVVAAAKGLSDFFKR